MDLMTLQGSPLLQSLSWLDGAAREEERSALRQRFDQQCPIGMMLSDEQLEDAALLAQDVDVLAYGPERYDRYGSPIRPMLLLSKPSSPDTLFIALNAQTLPQLWVEVEPSAEAILSVFEALAPATRPNALALTSRARLFMGYVYRTQVPSPYSGELEPAGPMELARFFTVSPWFDGLSWGSHYAEDPWPDRFGDDFSRIQTAVLQRRYLEQQPSYCWSETYRTLYSGAYFSVEVPYNDLYIAELSYAPAPFAPIVARFNATYDLDLPLDLPLDLVAHLNSFSPLSAAQAIQRIEALDADDVGMLLAWLYLWGALTFQQVDGLELLRGYLHHPDARVRQAVVNVAYCRNAQALLSEAALTAQDPEDAEQLTQALMEGIGWQQADPEGLGEDDDGADWDEEDDLDEEEL